ncbi:hypothetical protein BHM03_00037067 [Ensete ventricosum]|nr:hypothetical protein BHM03_00037067 [Ensete ventricosum]
MVMRINYDRENITIKGFAKVKSRHRAGVRTMLLGTRLECIGSSLRVSGVCQDGAREFVGRLTGVAKMLAGSWEGLTTTVKRSCRPDMEPGLPEEDLETHHKECRRLLDCGSDVIKLDGHVWL